MRLFVFLWDFLKFFVGFVEVFIFDVYVLVRLFIVKRGFFR